MCPKFQGMKGEEGKMMIFKRYPLSKFGDEDTAIKQLREFERYCSEFKVVFKYQKRTIKKFRTNILKPIINLMLIFSVRF